MKYHIITLGCPKNNVDSEGMDGILAAQGHTPVDDLTAADVVIVNTCSFIAAARDETLDVLRTLGKQKSYGQRLIAAGCMAESHGDLVQAVSGVDAILSTRQWMRIGEVVAEGSLQQGKAENMLAPMKHVPVLDLQPVAQTSATAAPEPSPSLHNAPIATPAEGYADWRTAPIRRTKSEPSAYLKISDGCNLRCAFCTIPSFKGDMRSKPVGAILGEAQELAARGVKEIVLVAQHLTDYGRDIGLKDGLALLLDELCALLPQDIWLRLMYAYPHGITPRLIETMARHPQICSYVDMPLQHAHADTLRRMRRPPDTEHTKQTIAALRTAMPDIALRSTFIVGFPGETHAEFQNLLDFLAEVQLDRVGAFRYSQEPGTAAASLPGQVRPRLIERRWHELMQLQQTISFARNQRWQNRTLKVLVEGRGESDDGRPLLVCRSFRDAPEVDGQVFVWGDAAVGAWKQVRITQAMAYDLWGDLVD
ncbi:MAG: 30S ribosomal protein S12 methylthiotransferase RimO [Chloroflexales bacterium]|nr:30S ribosomal protein S12 methylthiotransferase RimO [Chloroflexales bacterium]